MPKPKKPWREVIIWGDTGRLTREQIRAALDVVIAEREAEAQQAVKGAARPSDSGEDRDA